MKDYWDFAFTQASKEGSVLVIGPDDFEGAEPEILEAAGRAGFSKVVSDMPDEIHFARLH